jgi:hypothetical protein
MTMEILSRRMVFAACSVLLPLHGYAQPAAAAFVGNWRGDVPGIGAARLFITAVRPNGQIEGRMEFDLKSYTSTFGDKADTGRNTSRGFISGSTLMIETALGGRYELDRNGNQLSGLYTRGTTLRVPVIFNKT